MALVSGNVKVVVSGARGTVSTDAQQILDDAQAYVDQGLIDITAQAERAEDAAMRVVDIETVQDNQAFSTTVSNQYAFGSSFLCGTGGALAAGLFLNKRTVSLAVGATATQIKFKLWRRTASGNTTAAPGVNGTLVLDLSFTLAQLGVTAGAAIASVVIPFGTAIKTIEGEHLSYEVRALDASNAEVLCSSGAAASGTAADNARRLWYRTDATTWIVLGSSRKPSGSWTSVSTFVARDPNTIDLQSRVVIAEGKIATNASDVAGAKLVTDQLKATQTIGRSTGDPITGTNSAAKTYVFADPIVGDGRLSRVKFYSTNGGTIKLKRFTKSGNTYTKVGADLSLVLVAGLNTFSTVQIEAAFGGIFEVNANELIGYYTPSGGVTVFTTNTASGSGWVSFDTGESDSFTDATVSTSARLEASFEFEYLSLPSSASQNDLVDLTAALYTTASTSALAATISGYERKNGASYPYSGTINFPAAASGKERIDLVLMDRDTQVLSVATGTERNVNLDAAEYIPSAGGKAVVAAVSVTQTDIALADRSMFRGLIKVGREGEMAAHISRNQRMIRRTLGKMSRGVTGKIGGYGDSITALQIFNTQSAAPAPAPYAANQTFRDRISLYLQNYPADTLALYGLGGGNTSNLYDFGDGEGLVHAKIGFNWKLKEAIEQRAGVAWSYNNYGIASTNSSNTTGNGLDPARIALPLADLNDVMVIAFGMNERGSTTTYANIVNMIGQFLAVGTECIVMGCVRPNADQSVTAWRYTCDALEAAAMDAGAAFISTAMIADDRNIGGIGIPARTLCNANEGAGSNHPGVFELARYGEAMKVQLGI